MIVTYDRVLSIYEFIPLLGALLLLWFDMGCIDILSSFKTKNKSLLLNTSARSLLVHSSINNLRITYLYKKGLTIM